MREMNYNKMNEKELLYRAVEMWKNYIETESPLLDKNILFKMGDMWGMDHVNKNLPVLDQEQEELVAKLENLKNEILNGKFTK